MEQNQIYNRALKESLGNAAVSMLLENKMIQQEELAGLTMNIGYMFSTEDDEIEALFQLVCQGKVFPFAAQKGELMLVNVSEEQYQQTVENMKSFHDCLNREELPETPVQKARRIKNNKIVKKKGISVAEKLICNWDDERVQLRSVDDICKRALACLITVQIACDIANDNYQESLEYFRPFYQKYGVEDCLNAKEMRILDGSYEMQDAIDMDWAYEAYWALCWCLGLVRDISDASKICDCDKAIGFMMRAKDRKDFMRKCKLRSVREILDMQDLYFRYHWAINDTKAHADASMGKLNPSVVIERRRALEWILSSEEDWYEIPMHA